MKKRILSILLLCCMVLTMLPTTAFAAGKIWVGTEEELLAALADNTIGKITLTADITVSQTLVIDRQVVLVLDHSLKIDREQSSSGTLFHITKSGYLDTNAGSITDNVLNEGKFFPRQISGEVINEGEIIRGSFSGKVKNRGSINYGSFRGEVENAPGGKIANGELYGEVTNHGEIAGWKFYGKVTNDTDGLITSGEFYGEVVNNGRISYGKFYGDVVNNGTITGGSFFGTLTGGEIQDNAYIAVTFDSDGGSTVAAQRILRGQKAQRPAAPTKDGYTFIGWYNKADLQYINLPEWNFDYPVFENLELVAQWMEARPISTDPITYLDKDGNQQVCTAYTVLTSETKASILDYADKWYDLPAGWYVVEGNVTITPRLDTHGAVNLILTNGSHLTAEWGIDVKVGDTFTVYAQSTDEGTMGRLTACLPADFNLDRMVHYSVWPDSGMAGIGSSARWREGNDGIRESEGTIIINGGNIRAKGQDNASAIGGTRAEEIEFRSTDRGEVYNRRQGGSITINGGVVRTEPFALLEGNPLAVISVGIGTCQMGYGGSVTINGGTVIAEAANDAITTGDGGTITINGGDVTARGGVNNFGENSHRVLSGNGIGPLLNGSITINGGTVKASSEGDGFGIGGAGVHHTAEMHITINGGTIEATANRNNAAIGDKSKQKSSVTITGGVIHAVGKGSAAGIGSTGDIRIDSIEDFTLEPGEYIGLQFAKTKKLAGITADEGLSVETSTDGVHWSAYEGGSVNARFARLINHGEETWDQPLQQFVLLLSDAVVPQNMSVEELGLTTWSGSAAQIVDGNRGTYHWTRDQQVDNGYIVDMKENIVLHDVTVVMGDGDYMEQGVIEASTDKNEWTQIGTISGAQITTAYPEDVEARYLRVRMTKASSTWLKLAEVEVNLLSTSEDAPVLDVEGADAVIDHDLFTSYNTSGSGSLTVRNDTKPYASRLSILKNADGVMKTEVYADGAWHEAEGTGNELVTYDLSDIGQVEQVRISWEEDADLQLYEIALSDEQASEDAPDYSTLNEAIAAAEALDDEDYTTNSWNVLTSALETAKTVAADESATQEEVDNAANALNGAKAALQVKASEAAIDALQNVVDKANALQEDSLAELIANAQALLDDPANASSTAVVTAMLDLSEAMADLNTDESSDKLKEDLLATIDYIEENILPNLDNVRPGKVQELETAIAQAYQVYNNAKATDDEIRSAIRNLTEKAQELWQIVSKAELNALIEAAEAIAADGYSEVSYEALQAAIEAAKGTAADDDATTTEVTTAITNLATAIANLEEITLDTSALEHEIELVSEMIANIGNYVPSSVEGLQEKLDSAKTALNNATTQAEIDEATKTLREARLNARTKADTSALEELIAYVNSLDLSAYTKESAQAVIQDAARAEIMTNDPEITQAEVDDMVKTLQASVDNLVEVKNSTSAEDTTNTAAAAQTGLFAGVLAAAGAALIAVSRRKKKHS